MTTLLLSPSLLRCNKTKRRRQRQQLCHRLLRCPINKQKEGDDNVVVLAFFAMLQQNKKKKATIATLPSPSSLCCNKKREGIGNNIVITFFVALQQNKKKKVMTTMSFSLR